MITTETIEAGDIGEAFIDRYKGWLMRQIILEGHPKPIHQFVAGNDMQNTIICKDNKGRMCLASGTIEVKSLFENNGIRYGTKGSITIPIEIWENNEQAKKRDEWTWGWLYKYLHPDWVSATDTYSAITPGALAYLLYTGTKTNAEQKPFACIMFSDFTKLAERLKEIALEDLEVDLDKWNLPPATNTEFWNEKDTIHQNIWNVKLREVKDLAEITLINDGPMFIGNEQSVGYQMKYYNQLKYMAADEILCTDKADSIITNAKEAMRNYSERMTFDEISDILERRGKNVV